MKADVLIGLGLAGEGIVIKMKTPLRTINVDSVNPVGRVNFNRMYKRINDIRYSLNKTIETIQNYEGNLKIAKEMVNKPFELQDELTSARNRQKEINKILDTSGNENSKVVVEDDLEEERNESLYGIIELRQNALILFYSLCVILKRENAYFSVFVNNKFFCKNFVGFFYLNIFES